MRRGVPLIFGSGIFEGDDYNRCRIVRNLIQKGDVRWCAESSCATSRLIPLPTLRSSKGSTAFFTMISRFSSDAIRQNGYLNASTNTLGTTCREPSVGL